jgi:hypothetical protein
MKTSRDTPMELWAPSVGSYSACSEVGGILDSAAFSNPAPILRPEAFRATDS